MESSEGQAILQNGHKNPITSLKEKREAAKAKLIAKAHKDQKRFDCFMYSGMFCILVTFVTVVILIIKYFVDGYEDRDIVDHDESVVYERWKDYTTNELVNCSSDDPCRDWTCEYVKEHFRRTPEKCQYDDWMDQIIICFSILTFLAICACIFC